MNDCSGVFVPICLDGRCMGGGDMQAWLPFLRPRGQVQGFSVSRTCHGLPFEVCYLGLRLPMEGPEAVTGSCLALSVFGIGLLRNILLACALGLRQGGTKRLLLPGGGHHGSSDFSVVVDICLDGWYWNLSVRHATSWFQYYACDASLIQHLRDPNASIVTSRTFAKRSRRFFTIKSPCCGERVFWLDKLAALHQHLLGCAIVRSLYYLPNEVKLAGGYHITYTRYVVKHPPDMLIPALLLFHLCHWHLQIHHMLQCRKTSNLLDRAFLINHVSHPHRRSFMGLTQKRRYLVQISRWRYLVQISRWGLCQILLSAPIDWVATATLFSMSWLSQRLNETLEPRSCWNSQGRVHTKSTLTESPTDTEHESCCLCYDS